MAELIVSLIPLALGIVMSPLAIMALVAVLLSHRARTNGVAYLVGWALAVVIVLGISFAAAGLLEGHERRVPPIWVPTVRLLFGLLLGVAGWRIYRHGQERHDAMGVATTPDEVAAAAPQLPGWLRSIEDFTTVRSFLLGVGIFLLNPVDLSCAALAGLDIRLAALAPAPSAVVMASFGVLTVAPIAVPVAGVMVRGERVNPLLTRARTWIAAHTRILNAALVLLIAVLQVQKAIAQLLAY